MKEINENYFDEKENSTTLTDEQVDEISSVIEDAAKDSATAEVAAKAEEMKADSDLKLESQPVKIVTNPMTGKPMMVDESEDDEEEDSLPSFEEMLADDSIKPMNIDMTTVIIAPETVKPILEASFPQTHFSDEDIKQVIKAADRVKNKEEFSYYEAMPDTVKSGVNNMMGGETQSDMGSFAKQGKNYIVKAMLDNIVQDEVVNKATYDMNKMIKKGMNDIAEETKRDKYWEGSREFFMHEVDKKIKEYEEAGKSGVAKRFKEVKEAYRQSYTYEDMLAAYKAGKIRVKKIQIEKFNRSCGEFDFKYQRSQNVISTITPLIKKLDIVAAKHFDIDILKEFIVAFINYTKNMDVNNYKDHTFMYYFIYNINTVDYYDPENPEQVAHHQDIINNINKFLQAIVDRRAGK